MSSAFVVPLRELTAAHIDRFVAEEFAEGDDLEFKGMVPGRDGPDAWHAGATALGERARNEIFAEVIASANAHGGLMLLGVAESEDHPKRAKSVSPIPRCADLADRLHKAARDCIDPRLPVLEIEGVQMDESGAGVVVLRVPPSRLAPHRLNQTRECYIRRADRSEKMTMREIQDLTLQRVSEQGRLEERFTLAVRRFDDYFTRCHRNQPGPDLLGIRATAIPTESEQFISDLARRADLAPTLEGFPAMIGRTGEAAQLPVYGWRTRPIVRGVRSYNDTEPFRFSGDLYADGAVEFAVAKNVRVEDAEDGVVYPSWVLGLVANALLTAHRYRTAVGAPSLEYAVEVEVRRRRAFPLLGPWGRISIGGWPELVPNPLVLPRLSLGEWAEAPGLLDYVYRDLLNAGGVDPRSTLEVTLPDK